VPRSEWKVDRVGRALLRGEFRLKLFGWKVERRFVVIREEIREARASVGRKLIDVPVIHFVSSSPVVPTGGGDLARLQSAADMENRIAELKHDLGAHVSA